MRLAVSVMLAMGSTMERIKYRLVTYTMVTAARLTPKAMRMSSRN